ncbi:MAG: DedA family protein [Anaerolineae bacterium]|jgi:membrane protein DedA with SNARE-associated domain|nr:DedA family protein [Anaerolineae bacterium]
MINEIETFLIENLQIIFDSIGWFGVVALLLFENATGIIPSEIIMGLAGWMLLAAHDAPFYTIFIGGAIAALASTGGASIMYWAARLGGRLIVDRMARWFRFEAQYIERAENQFQRWGEGFVLFGRMIPIVRTLINIPAGLARMPYGKFALYTLIGSYIWCTLLVGAGYLLGHEWWRISGIVKQTAPWALLVGMIIWIAVIFYQRSRRPKPQLSS